MIFEVRYLAVFRPGATPVEKVREILSQVYTDELGDSKAVDDIASILQIDIVQPREDSGFIITFEISDDIEEGQIITLLDAFGKLLSADGSVEHLVKLHDTMQWHHNKKHAEEVYKLEMRLREAISFIFVHCSEGDYYNLLKDNKTAITVPTKPSAAEYKSHYENEFFFLLFSQYIALNERKLPTNNQDLIKIIGQSVDFPSLQSALGPHVIDHPEYAEFLAKIKELVTPVEQLRNCVAHNRSISSKVGQDYAKARDQLHKAIDDFFAKVRVATAPPPTDPGIPPPPPK